MYIVHVYNSIHVHANPRLQFSRLGHLHVEWLCLLHKYIAGTGMASPRLGLVVEDKLSELSCTSLCRSKLCNIHVHVNISLIVPFLRSGDANVDVGRVQ